MIKQELQTGMVVETRQHEKYLVVRNHCHKGDRNHLYFIGLTGHLDGESYTDKLETVSEYHQYDIIKVWEQKQLCNMNSMFCGTWLDEDRYGILIWDREYGDVVEMTMDEVCQALGKKVKIVADHK